MAVNKYKYITWLNQSISLNYLYIVSRLLKPALTSTLIGIQITECKRLIG